MPKDYAKMSRTRSSRSSSRRKNQSSGLWIVAVLLTGLFVAGLFYLKQQNDHSPKTEVTVATKEPAKLSSKAATQTTHFDFYTILPKSQTAAPQTMVNRATSTTISNKSNASATKLIYILQLGEFKEYSAADELKAEIVLQGYEVNITPNKKNALTLYRVWLGPYQTREQAQQQQKNLLSNQIKSVVTTLKKS
jgi:cell division protein FtsN